MARIARPRVRKMERWTVKFFGENYADSQVIRNRKMGRKNYLAARAAGKLAERILKGEC